MSLDDIVTSIHHPQVASVGLPFIMVELKNRAALENARSYLPAMEEIYKSGTMPDILVYIRSEDEFDIRARVFAPLDGIPEDPATGSAVCALVAMLSHYNSEREGDYSWRIAQGVEMKRPSILDARTEKRSGFGLWRVGCRNLPDGDRRIH
ncbi:MAG: PhzF family phenazine biosynthesis protein [Deltaproteobacteria bacterium]|nr:PhzF family phenazine biosynthesis protein [Deltaproteobacteria bacterium]